MSPWLRLAIAAVLAVSQASTARAATACPNEQTGASASENLGNCLTDARQAKQADEPRLMAIAYGRAAEFAREAYDLGKTGVTAAWFTDTGDQIVYYGTEGCAHAVLLASEQARRTLTTCVELLDAYLVDLAMVNAAGSHSAQTAEQRRGELQALRDALPPETVLPTVRVKYENTTNNDKLANRHRPIDPSIPRAPPRGLHAGLGTSGALLGLGIMGMVVGDRLGRDVSATVRADPAASKVPASRLCDENSTLPACSNDLQTARGVFLAGGILLGAAVISMAVFTGLRVRYARAERRGRVMRVTPLWVQAGVTVRF